MMVSVTRIPMRWITALARKIGLDTNPLRRRSDRAEAWIRLGLVLIFLAASPLAAVGLGNLTNAASMSAARAQAASERQVPAVLVKKVSRATDNPLYGSSELVWARAQWTAPDGQRRTGEVPAPVGSQAGHKEIIWVDSSGQLVYPPIGQGQIASRVIAVVALTPAALGALLMITLWLIRHFLDRRRMTSWASEWSAVEPQWTKRLH
jgi:F0F1-type ATP synthase membrane subunit c/vacuolar-type H+-ATPase subunit K